MIFTLAIYIISVFDELRATKRALPQNIILFFCRHLTNNCLEPTSYARFVLMLVNGSKYCTINKIIKFCE